MTVDSAGVSLMAKEADSISETSILNASNGGARDTHQPGSHPLGQLLFQCEDVPTLHSQLRPVLKLHLQRDDLSMGQATGPSGHLPKPGAGLSSKQALGVSCSI